MPGNWRRRRSRHVVPEQVATAPALKAGAGGGPVGAHPEDQERAPSRPRSRCANSTPTRTAGPSGPTLHRRASPAKQRRDPEHTLVIRLDEMALAHPTMTQFITDEVSKRISAKVPVQTRQPAAQVELSKLLEPPADPPGVFVPAAAGSWVPRAGADRDVAPDAAEIVLMVEDLPTAWGVQELAALLKPAGICLACDVEDVRFAYMERERESVARLVLRHPEDVQACLRLDGQLLAHAGGQRPVRVRLAPSAPVQDEDGGPRRRTETESTESLDELALLQNLLLVKRRTPTESTSTESPDEVALLHKLLTSEEDPEAPAPPADGGGGGGGATPAANAQDVLQSLLQDEDAEGSAPAVHADTVPAAAAGSGARAPEPQRAADSTGQEQAGITTTYVIRNLPQDWKRDMLIELLDRDYAGGYDFLYLPLDFLSRANNRYAFVNFRDALDGERFQRQYQDAILPGARDAATADSRVRLSVVPADVQGLQANVRRFLHPQRHRPTRHKQLVPLVFTQDGRAVPLCKGQMLEDLLQTLQVPGEAPGEPSPAAARGAGAPPARRLDAGALYQ